MVARPAKLHPQLPTHPPKNGQGKASCQKNCRARMHPMFRAAPLSNCRARCLSPACACPRSSRRAGRSRYRAVPGYRLRAQARAVPGLLSFPLRRVKLTACPLIIRASPAHRPRKCPINRTTPTKPPPSSESSPSLYKADAFPLRRVFVNDAAVRHGHFPTAKRHHLRAPFQVCGIKRRALELFDTRHQRPLR